MSRNANGKTFTLKLRDLNKIPLSLVGRPIPVFSISF